MELRDPWQTSQPATPPLYEPPPGVSREKAEIARTYGAHRSGARSESSIGNLRGYNNYIKSLLLAQFVKPQYVVLDICGGKGGDLGKLYADAFHLSLLYLIS